MGARVLPHAGGRRIESLSSLPEVRGLKIPAQNFYCVSSQNCTQAVKEVIQSLEEVIQGLL